MRGIGVLGAGPVVENAIIDPAKALGLPVVAIAARDSLRARRLAEAHAVPLSLGSYEELLSRADIDLVYVSVVSALHARWALAAIEAGKNVLVEKPFACNAQDARQVIGAARAQGVLALDGYHYAHHPVMRRLLEIVSSGELGTVTRVRAEVSMVAPPPESSRWSFQLGGGSMLDLGCYGIHACRLLGEALGGEPVVTDADARPFAADPRLDARMRAHLTFPDGTEGLVRCSIDESLLAMKAADTWRRIARTNSLTRGMVMRLKVSGDRGWVEAPNFVLPHLDDRLRISTKHGKRIERLGRVPSYRYQLKWVANRLEGSGMSEHLLSEPLPTMRLIDACFVESGLGIRPSGLGSGPGRE